MSHRSRNKPAIRKVPTDPTQAAPEAGYEEEDYTEYEEYEEPQPQYAPQLQSQPQRKSQYAPQPQPQPQPQRTEARKGTYDQGQRNAAPQNRAQRKAQQQYAEYDRYDRYDRDDRRGRNDRYDRYDRYAAPPRRDFFPYMMGGIIGAVLIGLLALIYLLGNNSNKSSSSQAPNPSTSGGNQGVPTLAPSAGGGQDPPRMPLDQFKALYDDQAKRPLIIDVRDKQTYDQGHIAGAVSFPVAEVDSRFSQLPKDRLVVAYCQ